MNCLTPDRLGLGALAVAIAVAAWAPSSSANTRPAGLQDTVALRCGTVYLVEGDAVLEGGATILMTDGKIQAVGKDIDLPPNARVVDYGPDAVVVPGFVAASGYQRMSGGARTAEPDLMALEEFDFHANFASTLTGGVTSMYLSAAENRLIGGQGAVVKLSGEDADARTLASAAVLQGAIDGSARNTPGFWEPPIPATVDVGLGYQVKQLPHTTMGAILALEELVTEAKDGTTEDSPYGPAAGPALAQVLKDGKSWRIAASTPAEIRALLSFGQAHGIKLVIDRAWGAGSVAKDIAKAGADVIWRFPLSPIPGRGRDWGKGEDARWPDYAVPAALEDAGVRFAIAPPRGRDVLFAATSALRGGLSEAAALRAVTLAPAEILGVADRVGSIRAGKDADLVVLNAAPLSGQASVTATWVGGKLAWEPTAPFDPKAGSSASRGASNGQAVVLVVDELHVGDGEILKGGEILLLDGKIREVGAHVSRPMGAKVVHGAAAMPGIVDAMGYLGLEGSRKAVSADYALSQIVAPGDRVDRRVANAGVTTVVLTPRGTSRGGSPLMAYKPAAQDFDQQVIADPTAVRVNWTDRNRAKSGAELREVLAKAADYKGKWEKYEKDIAAWTPPAPKADKDESAEDSDKEEAEEADKGDSDKKKKKKKKKDEEEELEPDPVTGVWVAQVKEDDEADEQRLRMRLHLVPEKGSGDMTGNLRCDLVSDTLVDLEGSWDREAKSLSLTGLGSNDWVSLILTLEDGKLTGTCTSGAQELAVSADRSSKEWVVAARTRTVSEKEKVETPKGMPKAPRKDARLEPFKEVLEGNASLLVNVDRADEILACVKTCAKYGVQPILVGAKEAYKVADQLVGHVAGVMTSQPVVVADAERGTTFRTPWADLQNAGLRVAFYSGAEEGAIDLPVLAAYAISNGMSPAGALRALTADTADMFSIGDHVGRLRVGLDADVLLLDGPPLAPGTRVLRAFVNGSEVE